jgi:hypothetical protein
MYKYCISFYTIQYGKEKIFFLEIFENFLLVCIKLYADCIALHFAPVLVFVSHAILSHQSGGVMASMLGLQSSLLP